MGRQNSSRSPHVPQGMKTLCPTYLHISGSKILHNTSHFSQRTELSHSTYCLRYPGLYLLSLLASLEVSNIATGLFSDHIAGSLLTCCPGVTL